MATNTLVQRLEAGESGVMNRSQTETFILGGTVVLGDWVALDASQTGADKALTVIKAGAAANGNPLVVGVVLSSAETSGALTSGSRVTVIVAGYAASARTNGAPAAGQPIVVQTVAGAGDAAGAGITAPPCGAVLADLGGGKAEVLVYKHF